MVVRDMRQYGVVCELDIFVVKRIAVISSCTTFDPVESLLLHKTGRTVIVDDDDVCPVRVGLKVVAYLWAATSLGKVSKVLWFQKASEVDATFKTLLF